MVGRHREKSLFLLRGFPKIYHNMKSFFPFVIFLFGVQVGLSQPLENLDSLRSVINSLTEEKQMALYLELCTGKPSSRKDAQRIQYFAPEAKLLAKKLSRPNDLLWIKVEEAAAIGLLVSREQALDSLNLLLEDVRTQKNKELLFNAYSIKGNQLIKLDSMGEALSAYQTTLRLAKEIPDSNSVAIAYNNLGNVSNQLGRSKEAIAYYTKSLKIKERLGIKSLAGTYNNISQIYKSIGEYEESLIFNRKAMVLQRGANNRFGLSISHLNMGNTFRQLKKYDSALFYNEGALVISESIKDTLGFAFAYYNIASVYYSKENYKKSISFYEKAAPIFEKYGMRNNTAQVYLSLSSCYRFLKEFIKAKEAVDKAWETANDLNSFNLRQELAETYYELYKAKGNYQLALDYHEMFKAYSDSILNETTVKEIGSIKKDYEVTNRDNQIALLASEKNLADLRLKQQNILRNWLIIVIVLIVLIVVIIYSRYRLKTRAEAELALKNRQLEELNTAKDKFFAIIAHDLRNPLSAFRMLTTGLQENISHFSRDEIREQLESLAESSNQLTELLHNLLQWALSQTATLEMIPQTINLRELLKANMKLIEETAQQKNITLSLDTENNLNSVVDVNSMDLVFRNLLTNAMKFTKPNGEIRIQGTIEDDFVKISIRDNGIGIAKKEQGLLFDLKKDSRKIGSSPNKGTGLGLVLCKEFIKKNNGRIELESELGKGSVFMVYVPRELKKTA